MNPDHEPNTSKMIHFLQKLFFHKTLKDCALGEEENVQINADKEIDVV